MQIEALMALLIVVPLIAWLRWHKSVSTIYTGPASMDWKDRSVADKSKYWASFTVPNLKNSLMVTISQSRFNSAPILASYQVVVKKRPLSQAWVEQVTWEDGTIETPAQEHFEGLLPSVFYFALAFAAVFAAKDYNLGTIGYLTGGLSLAMAGFTANLFRFTSKDLKGSPMRLLKFINLGSGVAGLLLGALVLGGLAAACFWQPTFFMFFPGINCAFEFGGIVALLVTALGDSGNASTASTSRA